MHIHHLSETPSILNTFLYEIRDKSIKGQTQVVLETIEKNSLFLLNDFTSEAFLKKNDPLPHLNIESPTSRASDEGVLSPDLSTFQSS